MILIEPRYITLIIAAIFRLRFWAYTPMSFLFGQYVWILYHLTKTMTSPKRNCLGALGQELGYSESGFRGLGAEGVGLGSYRTI